MTSDPPRGTDMNTAMERIVFVLLVLAVAGGVYWWWTSRQEPAPLPVAPPVKTAAPQVEPEPAVQHPIQPAPPAGEAEKPLPTLAESDAAAIEALAGLFAQRQLPEFLVPKNLIRRIVATVDNLPREKVALQLWPVKPAAGAFQVIDTRDGKVIGAENAGRYAPYVQWMESIDTRRLAALYARLYPLFQQAYQELGYPKGYFNDRLVQVIDHLLETPEVRGVVRVEQPKVLYEFVDPVLKDCSAGQKILLRIGSDNAGRVKAKLRELRGEVARRVAKPQ